MVLMLGIVPYSETMFILSERCAHLVDPVGIVETMTMEGIGFPWKIALIALSLGFSASGCPDDPKPPTPPADDWTIVAESPQAALLSVHGTSSKDVWLVGADDGEGPMVLHWDGTTWERRDTGVEGDLWWVRAFDDGTVMFAGSDALVLRYRNGAFERLATPGLGKTILFGLWGPTSDDVYAVGSSGGRNGLLWHFDGTSWSEVPVPDVALNAQNDLPGFTKVWGTSSDDVWVVGGRGAVLRGNRTDGFTQVETGTNGLLFTVHGNDSGRVVVVGGANSGVAYSLEGDQLAANAPDSAPLLQGVWVAPDGTAWVSGGFGFLYRGVAGQPWEEVDHGLDLFIESLHATWVDPDGGVWSVGGNVLTSALNAGVAIHNRAIATIQLEPDTPLPATCPADAIDPEPDKSVARRWNEQLLNAIRRDTPRPTVHARNLFHVSAATWDAWAAYQTVADGYLVTDKHTASDVEAARHEAISYAAYRVLTHRYVNAVGGDVSSACFDAFMGVLGYDTTDTITTGDTPRALGNRIGQAYIDAFADDGSNEANDYADPEDYTPDQPRLIVDLPGSATDDPLVWQQLILAEAVTQNGIPEGSGSREYIGAHWGAVTPFAMARPSPGAPYYDIGEPPVALDQRLVDASVEVIRFTAWLDIDDGEMMDVSPASIGNSTLGTDDGTGYDANPVTQQPYAPIMVKRGDFGRILAEFWADGPDSETPPGHWNTLAHRLGDNPAFERKLFGQGESLDPLAWDVHLFFALNGAVHDAAISAWELKREYISARPITLIRTMGALGQRTDDNGPSFHPDGLPLEPGLIEVITQDTAANGGKHAHLSRYIGEIAVWSWRGEPGDRDNAIGGIGWIRAKDWIPYQRRTFVTPAFPGYVSGHSTFSRAAAQVLTELTGSPYFPGGSSEATFQPGFLHFEAGPTEPITLRWATFFDASDQAGQSRIWGGIHVNHDDYDGRIIGSQVGTAATALARTYFEGTARIE